MIWGPKATTIAYPWDFGCFGDLQPKRKGIWTLRIAVCMHADRQWELIEEFEPMETKLYKTAVAKQLSRS